MVPWNFNEAYIFDVVVNVLLKIAHCTIDITGKMKALNWKLMSFLHFWIPYVTLHCKS